MVLFIYLELAIVKNKIERWYLLNKLKKQSKELSMAKGNKLYSDKQESSIAEFLGWHQVTGSGARPNFVGDIESCDWLGECKTHVEPGHKIVFNFNVWDKLEKEANSRFKEPALFVDDGSQLIENTFVMIKLKVWPEGRIPKDCSNKSSFRFDNETSCRSDYALYEFSRDKSYFIILWLPAFKEMIKR